MKKILYVDDDPSLSLIYRELLESEGHEVWTALSGEAGLDLLEKRGMPDLLLVDYSMPKMDGLQFLLAARNRFPQLAEIRIVGFTGHQNSFSALNEFRKLTSEVVQKPNELDDFLLLIKRLL